MSQLPMRSDMATDEFRISNVRFFAGDENFPMVALYGQPSIHGDGWIANLGLHEVFSIPPTDFILEEFYDIHALGAHELCQDLGLRIFARELVQAQQDFSEQPASFIHQPDHGEPAAAESHEEEICLDNLVQDKYPLDEPVQHESPLDESVQHELHLELPVLDESYTDQRVSSESEFFEPLLVEASLAEPAKSIAEHGRSRKAKSDRKSKFDSSIKSDRQNNPLTGQSLSGTHKKRAPAVPHRPIRRKELIILITVGWALLAVFVLTVLGGLLPLQPRNLAWSQNLSRLVVDAGSLALVGLVLVRYGSYLRSLDLPRTRQSRSSSKTSSSKTSSRGLPLDQSARDQRAMERNRLWVRRFATAGAVGMLLLAVLQVVNFQRGATSLDLQLTQASLEQGQQFERLEAALLDAPADRLRQGWIQLKKLDPANLPATLPAPARQLDDLIAEANRSRDSAQRSLNQQFSSSRFALGRDSLRVLLASLMYGWAFWAFVRRA